MFSEDTIGYRDEGETCIVCGKRLKPGEALATMHQGGSKLPLCCPLCLETYQKDPQPYLERLAKRALLQDLRNAVRTQLEQCLLDE
jgi:hypothetical protein